MSAARQRWPSLPPMREVPLPGPQPFLSCPSPYLPLPTDRAVPGFYRVETRQDVLTAVQPDRAPVGGERGLARVVVPQEPHRGEEVRAVRVVVPEVEPAVVRHPEGARPFRDGLDRRLE